MIYSVFLMFWMSCSGLMFFFVKAGQEFITIVHAAADEDMNEFLQVLTQNKKSNSCNVFEMQCCLILD